MDSRSFLSLLQFSDGLFPAGGYAHSYGLETYVQEGVIRDLEGVEKFIRAYLKGNVGPCDAVAVVAALNLTQAENLPRTTERPERECGDEPRTSPAPDTTPLVRGECSELPRRESPQSQERKSVVRGLPACLDLDETLEAMKPVAEFREASRQMGRQTLRVAVALVHHPLLSALMNHVESYRTPGHHALVFGLVGGVLGWPKREAAAAFLFTTTSLLVGASLRLLPIGQVAGQSLLHRLGPLIADLAADAERKGPGDLWSFAPGIEIAGMRHATLEARLFRS